MFVRTDVLRAANGWDGTCLAEDCDLGVRLSSRGAKCGRRVRLRDRHLHKERDPRHAGVAAQQRTRWNQAPPAVSTARLRVAIPGSRRSSGQQDARTPLATLTQVAVLQVRFSGIVIPDRHRHVRARGRAAGASLALITFVSAVIPNGRNLVFHDVACATSACSTPAHPLAPLRARSSSAPSPTRWCWPWRRLRAVWREYTGKRNWGLTAHTGAHLTKEPVAAKSGVAA
ncbi:hypothetical protein GCM10020358_43650 [Amorphoplanes nipponensis]